jgi:hypothetical protein
MKMSHHLKPKFTVDDFDLIQTVCMDVNGLPKGKLVPKVVAQNIISKGRYEFFQCEFVIKCTFTFFVACRNLHAACMCWLARNQM